MEGVWHLDPSHAPQAAILFDKFHVLRHLGKALDTIRKREYGRLQGKPRTFIKGQKYTLLAHPQNLTGSARKNLKLLLAANKRLNTAYLLKESFGQLWDYNSEAWARKSMLSDAAQNWSTRVAVVDADGPQRLTFAQLDERADRAAAGLAELGIAASDRVLLQLPNSCEFAVALFALLRVGAIPVMCLTGHRAAELGHFAAVSEATALLIPDKASGFDYRPMAQELSRDHPGLRHVIVDGDPGPFTSWSQVCAINVQPPEPHDPDPESPALLLVSGGTTGTPKLIPRTHNDYVYNATASAELCKLTAEDVYMAALPAAHNFPLACPGLLGAIAVGAPTVFLSNPSPESAFGAIARHGVTVTALVPALANLWAQATEWEPEVPT